MSTVNQRAKERIARSRERMSGARQASTVRAIELAHATLRRFLVPAQARRSNTTHGSPVLTVEVEDVVEIPTPRDGGSTLTILAARLWGETPLRMAVLDTLEQLGDFLTKKTTQDLIAQRYFSIRNDAFSDSDLAEIGAEWYLWDGDREHLLLSAPEESLPLVYQWLRDITLSSKHEDLILAYHTAPGKAKDGTRQLPKEPSTQPPRRPADNTRSPVPPPKSSI